MNVYMNAVVLLAAKFTLFAQRFCSSCCTVLCPLCCGSVRLCCQAWYSLQHSLFMCPSAHDYGSILRANCTKLRRQCCCNILHAFKLHSGGGKASDKGSAAAQPSSSASSVPSSKAETTGPLYAPSNAKPSGGASSQQSSKKDVKPQPSSGSGLPKKKEETTGGRY